MNPRLKKNMCVEKEKLQWQRACIKKRTLPLQFFSYLTPNGH